jgi:hypothetical protein
MEPFSALAIATSIAQFIDFGSKVLQGAIEIHKSSSGQLDQHRALQQITRSLADLTAPLDPNTPSCPSILASDGSSPNDLKIEILCKDCYRVAIQLRAALDKLTAQGDTEWGNLKKALRSIWDADKIKDLQSQLDGYRQELVLLILVALR